MVHYSRTRLLCHWPNFEPSKLALTNPSFGIVCVNVDPEDLP